MGRRAGPKWAIGRPAVLVPLSVSADAFTFATEVEMTRRSAYRRAAMTVAASGMLLSFSLTHAQETGRWPAPATEPAEAIKTLQPLAEKQPYYEAAEAVLSAVTEHLRALIREPASDAERRRGWEPGEGVLDARPLEAMSARERHDYVCRLEAAVLDMARELLSKHPWSDL